MNAQDSHIWSLMGLGPHWVLKGEPNQSVTDAQGATQIELDQTVISVQRSTAVFGDFEVHLDSSGLLQVFGQSGVLIERMFQSIHWGWADFTLVSITPSVLSSGAHLAAEALACKQWLVFGGQLAQALGCTPSQIEQASGFVLECSLQGAQRQLFILPAISDLLTQSHAKARAWKGLCLLREIFCK